MIEKRMIEPVVNVGNLDSLRTYAYVRDAVRAYYLLVMHNPVAGAYYNIGGTFTCTIGDMLHTLISMSSMKENIKIEIDPERLRPIDADLQIPDTTKFKEHTGWNPKIPFETTMQDILDYWRNRIASGTHFLTR
jgi:GDPmannose 4,6-dehydratase